MIIKTFNLVSATNLLGLYFGLDEVERGKQVQDTCSSILSYTHTFEYSFTWANVKLHALVYHKSSDKIKGLDSKGNIKSLETFLGN